MKIGISNYWLCADYCRCREREKEAFDLTHFLEDEAKVKNILRLNHLYHNYPSIYKVR